MAIYFQGSNRPGFGNFSPRYEQFSGRVVQMEDVAGGGETGCSKYVIVENEEGEMVNFIVNPNTYFVDEVKIDVEDMVYGFYNANAPALLIYPPQLEAVAMGIVENYQNVKLDWFNDELISSDGLLQIELAPETERISENGQNYAGGLTGHPLIVIYGASTRSMPARAIPEKIIVLCRY